MSNIKRFVSRLFASRRMDYDKEYMDCVKDLLSHEDIQSLDNFVQHKHISRLRHSLSVSYRSFRICKAFGLDYVAAARGGLLHDFFLYSWECEDRPTKREHVSLHPKIALENARKHFEINHLEQDIIVKHMWPMTITLPKYKESWIIAAMDKLCAIYEVFNTKKSKEADKFLTQLENMQVQEQLKQVV